MKAIAQESAPQIALRACSKEVLEKVRIDVILVKESTYSQTHIFAEGFC